MNVYAPIMEAIAEKKHKYKGHEEGMLQFARIWELDNLPEYRDNCDYVVYARELDEINFEMEKCINKEKAIAEEKARTLAQAFMKQKLTEESI